MNCPDRPARPPRKTCAVDHSAFAQLGEASDLFDSGHIAPALRIATRLLSRDPKHVPALELVARCHWSDDDYTQVLRVASRLIRLNPGEPGYRIMQAMAYQAMGHFALAVRTLKQCQEETTRPDALARVRRMLDHLDDAQAQALSNLRRWNSNFAKQYDRNPGSACAEFGLEFSCEERDTNHSGELTKETAQATFGVGRA